MRTTLGRMIGRQTMKPCGARVMTRAKNPPHATMAVQSRSSPFTHTGQITTKVPPSFNGTDDWFRYEESVEEWLDLTELPVDKNS